MTDIARNIKHLQSIAPQSANAGTVNGIGIDFLGYQEAIILLNAGTLSTGTIDAKVQESDDNSSFTDITGATFAQVSSSNHLQTFRAQILRVPGRKRYLRVVAVITTAACLLSAEILLVRPDYTVRGSAPDFTK